MGVSNKKKILIVDDNDDLRDSLKFLLETEGFRVDAVSDGENAANIAVDTKIDLIFLDMIMPIKDGRTVLQEIGQTNIDPKICIMTACYSENTKEYFEKVTKQKITAMIRKPFEPKKLVRIARKLTGLPTIAIP